MTENLPKNTLELTTLDVDRDKKDIEKAAEILRDGGIVAIPTETVYGLGADAFNGEAVKKIFAAKGRPQDNPLIVHISRFDEIYSIAKVVPEEAKILSSRFWPGPLTIILPKRDEIPNETSGGLSTVAVRMPSHPVARAIIALAGPLAAPSANISGLPSPTCYEHVMDDMKGRADAICNGGDCSVGVESTVITLAETPPKLLRPGGVTLEELRSVLGEVEVSSAVLNPLEKGEKAASPGMKYKHYAPNARVTVVRGSLDEFKEYAAREDCDGVLCFCGEEKEFPGKITVTFGERGDGASQARRLFDALRELDEAGAENVLAVSPSKEGVGLAVCNRLYRAAGFNIVSAVSRPIVGLTGPTGAGKGYVSQVLEKRGFFICDTDKVARELTAKGSPFLQKLADSFGGDILLEDGSLNRSLLAERAFACKESQERLNSLTHPEILRIAYERCMDALDGGCQGAVIDAPLLFESGGDKMCNTVISVIAPREIRLQRIQQRDGISREAALLRMAAQQEDEFYTSRSEFTVRSYAPWDTEKELEPFFAKYLKR